MNDFEKKKMFLISKPEYISYRASNYFPFTQQQLRKYKSILDWAGINDNRQIKWSADLIREFKFWISKPASKGLGWINENPSVPWSIELIEEFKDDWYWEYFVRNEKIIGNAMIRNRFHTELKPFLTDEIISKMIDKNFGFGEYNKNQIWEKIEKYYFKSPVKEFMFHTIKDIVSAENIDWLKLSYNSILPWSVELIEKYKNNWHWPTLSSNETIPWNEEWIDIFKDYVAWGKWEAIDYNNTVLRPGLSFNNAIKWDMKLINRYRYNLEFHEISQSRSAQWNIDLLLKFYDHWDYKAMSFNNTLWNKVFPEFNDALILETLDSILKNKFGGMPVKYSFGAN